MKFSRLFLGMSLWLVLISSVFSVNLDVNITEASSLTYLSVSSYSLSATGTLEVYNPSNVSAVYEVSVPMDFDSLVGLDKISLDNSSSKFTFTADKITAFLISPNETVRVGYRIFGLVNYNLYNVLNSSVLEYYADSFDAFSSVLINLEKPIRETETYDENGTLTSIPLANASRVITAGLRNPSDFDYLIRELSIYRSYTTDPFLDQGVLIERVYNVSVNPFENKQIDVFDRQSTNNSVYWVSSDVSVQTSILSSYTTSYSVQQPAGSGGGGGGSSSGGSGFFSFNISGFDEAFLNSLIIKKTVDKTLIQSGDEIIVTLTIANTNDLGVSSLRIIDTLPKDYELKEVSDQVVITNGTLEFSIDSLEGYGTYTITYKLENKQQYQGITYLKPARLIYEDSERYSQGVLIINELLPNKKIFVQKDISYEDDTYARVTIKVKNLGGVLLENLLITDNIDNGSLVKEISKIFFENELGVWRIEELKSGDEWVVTYLVERNDDVDTLPNVFGVESSSVFGTVVASEEIVYIYRGEPRLIEKVGMGLSVALLIFYLLF